MICIGLSFYKLRFAAGKTEVWTIIEDKTSDVSGVTRDGVQTPVGEAKLLVLTKGALESLSGKNGRVKERCRT